MEAGRPTAAGSRCASATAKFCSRKSFIANVGARLSATVRGITTRVDKAPSVKENEKASQQGVDAINHANLHTATVPEWRNWQTR